MRWLECVQSRDSGLSGERMFRIELKAGRREIEKQKIKTKWMNARIKKSRLKVHVISLSIVNFKNFYKDIC